MGYKRRGRRKYSKKFNARRNGLSKKLSKLSSFVYKTIENKTITTESDVFLPAGVWTAKDLTYMSQATGPTVVQRIGAKVTITSLQCKLTFSNLKPYQSIRVMIVQFPNLQTPGAPIVHLGEVLQYSSPVPPISENQVIQSMYKLNSSLKFRILYNKVISSRITPTIIETAAGTAQAGPPPALASWPTYTNYGNQVFLNIRVKMKNNVLAFLPGALAITPYKNMCVLYTFNNNVLAHSTPIQLSEQTRMKYRDA